MLASLRRVRPAVAVLLGSLVLVPMAPTHAIVGGEKAHREDVVQVITHDPKGGYSSCTGTAISAEWVLTAGHCVEGDSWNAPDARPADVKVHYSNNKNDRGPATDVDRFEKAPGTDMALLHLATHHPLPTYPKVTTSYKLANFVEGDPAEMYGYGLRNHDAKSDWLYRADVLV